MATPKFLPALLTGLRARPCLVRTTLTLFSALLTVLAQPAIGDVAWLGWLCFVPWLFVAHQISVREGAWLGLLVGFAFSFVGKWQTMNASVQNAGLPPVGEFLAHLAIFVPMAAPFIVLGTALPLLQRRSTPLLAALAGAALFALTSELCSRVPPYTVVALVSDTPWFIQVADFGGLALVCFLLIFLQQLGALALRAAWRREPVWPPLLIGGLLIALVGAYGQYRLHEYRTLEEASEGVRLAVLGVQTQVPKANNRHLVLRDGKGGALSPLELSRRGLAQTPEAELIVWPEIALDAMAQGEEYDPVCRAIAPIVASLGHPLLLNCERNLGEGVSQSEALLVDARGAPLGRYQKSNLVPFFEGGRDLIGLPTFVEGEGAHPLALPDGRRLLPAICFDIQDADLMREGVREGGQFILHMANFAAFNHSPQISAWDLSLARLRAVETRRPIVRVANAGHSGLILASGEDGPQGMSPDKRRSARLYDAFAPQMQSPFVRWGKGPVLLILVLLVVLPLVRMGYRARSVRT